VSAARPCHWAILDRTAGLYCGTVLRSLSTQVDMALVPAVSGDFGVMPGHVPTLAELRPGVVAVHKEMDKDVVRTRTQLWR
jgi:ATP synthase, Delta/Epsilon chain, beta-sandwich domain